jgi:cation-transporting P-type ATPase E
MAGTEQAMAPVHHLAGLTEQEAAARLARGEGNAVPFATSRSYRRILLQNAFTFINTVLYAIAIILLVLGLPGDAFVTAGLVLLNVGVGVVQESRAKRQLDRIALLNRPTGRVIRDGQERFIEPGLIVRDDLVVVSAGEQVLVDGVVVGSGETAMDESLLTGESDLVTKRAGDKVFSGSFCMTGSAVYRAERVGAGSVAQQITAGARAFREVQTPLQREIGLVIRVMVFLTLALGAQLFFAYRHTFDDLPLSESVRAAAVIVALVPQGLAFMITLTYAMAAVRMAGKGALIQRMNAVESSSHVDVLCVDKTGTLTTNQLKLQALHPSTISEDGLRRILGDVAASTTAGNRTTAAIAAACPGEPRRVLDEAPFSSERKWSALALDDSMKGLYVLGAPEMLRPSMPAAPELDRQAEGWTAEGLRVLLFARAAEPVLPRDESGHPALPPEMTPLGLVALSDELRPEARETISGFANAGIALKVISGDHPDTIAALATQAGIVVRGPVVSGLELDGMDDPTLAATVEESTIFGRITPPQKERLVRALRQRGHYVAMTGDGVNDVLALKQADLAIAMRSGSQVARSVSDIVLLNDSFAVLPAAFREGQRILNGMEDVIRLFLARTGSQALLILAVSLLGERFPLTPKQNAVLALLTVGIPTIFLAAWARPGLPPRRLLPSAGHFVVPAMVTIAGVALTVYLFFTSVTKDVALARTALTVTTVLCGLILIPYVRPPSEAWTGGTVLSGDRRPAQLALALLAVFLVVLVWTPARRFYALEPLTPAAYPLLALVVLGWAVALRFIWRLNPGELLVRGMKRLQRHKS